MLHKPWLIGTLLCLHVSAASALTLEEILTRNQAARGGAKSISALRSLRLTGKVRLSGSGRRGSTDAQWGLVRKRPALYRSETTLQGLTQVVAYDGREGWSFRPFGGRREAERASVDESRALAQEADLAGPLVDWREKGHRVAYLGTEDVDGTQAHKLRVTLQDGDTQYVFLDEDTFLEIRVVYERHLRGTEQITETDLGSYEQVEGVWVPFSMETGRKGGPKTARFTVERAEANVEADDALFRFPAPGATVERAIIAGPPSPVSPRPPAPPPAARPAVLDAGVISGLGARNIGSAAMSGRIAAVAGHNQDGKATIYVGAASGGVWKSVDGGTTFRPVFDQQRVQSIGAIAIDPSNPQNIWVGTGESWVRNSVSIGDGIYKSTDGGETWTNMGLPKSERIVRILVNPKDGNVVYACVPGALWSDSPDRGLYKTTDGGKTWDLILTGPNLSTGCATVSMDPQNPGVLIAGLWDFRRKGWTFRSGGDGPNAPSGSALFRSTDGGGHWTELVAGEKGLPPKPWGRVEVAIAPSDGRVVYAFVESTNPALYRSADGGATWEARDRSQSMVWRPFYFARLIVDPRNADRLFKPNLQLIASEDGGRSFSASGGRAHGDWHDLWIDPDNTKHIVGGDDGGLWISFDGGSRWWKSANLPLSQFYHVSADAKDPYQVYGGLQDNSSWVGDSQYEGGISNSRWENLYGGDGFWTVPDPSDPDAVYAESQGGHIGRVDRHLRAMRELQPQALYKEKLRFNWNTPIAASPSDKSTLYIGAQFLFRSKDRGDNWERISPDLTSNDASKQKQEQSGGVTVDNSSAEMHTSIYSISESPKNHDVIWVGTDDGHVQLTRDGGKSWRDVVAAVPGLPPASWVSWVEASRFDAGSAYAAFDRHTFGDMTPWVYRTTDFGKSWTRIVGPQQGVRGYAHVIKEDAVKPSLLLCGTELGLWISADAGGSWAEFKGGNFPSVAVRDLVVHPREHDLVIATHGRGIWIVDDLTPLRALSADLLAREVAFLPGRPMQQRMQGPGGWSEGDATFVGENPVGGAAITYYQRRRHIYGQLKLEVLDTDGKVLDRLPASTRRGLNRVVWPMLAEPPRVPKAAQVAFRAARGPRLPPGIYSLRLTKGSEIIQSELKTVIDRRAPYDVAARKEQFQAAMRVHALFGEMSALVDRIEASRGAALARARVVPESDELSGKLRALAEKLADLRKQIVATKEGGAITGEERIREHADDLYGAITTWEGRPARYQVERIDALGRELADVARGLDGLIANEIRPLDDALRSRRLEPIPTQAARQPAQDAAAGGSAQ
jgi:photosystem II stability/assembly factor-like uncharacterized protein/outer membrane lipoprotein-sorting protein